MEPISTYESRLEVFALTVAALSGKSENELEALKRLIQEQLRTGASVNSGIEEIWWADQFARGLIDSKGELPMVVRDALSRIHPL
jgi:ATP-dependent DNA ligase